ncbi:hypothetical protein [Psychrobacter sp. I-STPA6b]|uniref:hypothetical protein n=1 Tax=Psychrobacter sp. I-STPA6b TaxID=2585718 RepID=UPI001D0BFBD1|nr:hypothetical protein [Psychrobacter sp. I-STPA6b]
MQPIKTLLAILIASSLTACASQVPSSSNGTTTTQSTTQIQSQNDQNMQVIFLDKQAGTQLLATEDDYLKVLSPFDWLAKFKSERPLNQQELQDYYAKATVNWDAASKQKVMTAVEVLQRRIADMHFNNPPTLKFVLTNGLVESGAAYTRDDYIVLTTSFLQESQADINHLVAHEFFHVYSRYNQSHRDALYGTVNFKKIPPLELPSQLDDLRISNPDAPRMDYGIDLQYQGKTYTFVPISLAHTPYDVQSNLPFFAYLVNGLLAVTTKEGKSVPVLTNNQPIIVDAEDTNFYSVVQPNSEYLNDPEEVSAENFSNWVVGNELKHQQPVDKLLRVMQDIQ